MSTTTASSASSASAASASASVKSAKSASSSASKTSTTTTNIQSDKLIEIFKSRKIIIEQLEGQKYDVTQYKDFGMNEVNTLIQTKQLDMLLSNPSADNKKVYIKYHLSGSLRSVNIYEYVDDLFNLEEVLQKKDDLIVVIK